MSEPVTIVLTMTGDEATAVSAVLRGYIADRWGAIDPVAKSMRCRAVADSTSVIKLTE
jgi:hypothetical protein